MINSKSESAGNLPDILRLIFEQLEGDHMGLCNVGLTCRAWRTLSMPHLLRTVDLSSHNNGRLPHFERPPLLPLAYADYRADYRPKNLVPRQRAFLRFINARPALAKYVKSLAWTLIWKDFDDSTSSEIDRQTWNVFSKLNNVTQLDLASLHEIYEEDVVRLNPTTLFPAVTDVRLLGWMHRGLVKAIVSSLRADQLRSLKTDYLQDEGALPNGAPMSAEIAEEYAHSARNRYDVETIDDELFRRQETCKACIFPGPMWLPLRLLSTHSLDSLAHLQVKVTPFNMDADLRNYQTLFIETAKLLTRVNKTLRSLVIVFGESTRLHKEYDLASGCGTSRNFVHGTYRPWCVVMAGAFLNQLLAALKQKPFPQLSSIRFEGFHILETASPEEAEAAQLADTFQSIRECPFINATFTELSSVDGRDKFNGIYCPRYLGGFSTTLLRSS